MKTVSEPEPHWLTQSQMADACGVSVQAFQRWGIEPIAKCGRSKYYLVSDVIDNRVELMTKNTNPAPQDFNPELVKPELETALLKQEQRRNMALRNDILERRLAPVELQAHVIGKVMAAVGSLFDALPLEIKRRNPEIPTSVIESIKSAVVTAQNNAAETDRLIEEYIDDFISETEARVN